MKHVPLILAALVVAGSSCVELPGPLGTEIDVRRAETLVPYSSTLADAVAAFGETPNGVSPGPNGGTIAEWSLMYGKLSEPETLRFEYVVTARFNARRVLIDVVVRDFREDGATGGPYPRMHTNER